MQRLEGKAVVITGAARGLGEAYARAAAAEGASLVLNDIDAEPLGQVVEAILASGAKVIAHPGDVSQWHLAESLIARCEAEFGHIDGLVNNAGILVMKPIEEQDEASFRRQIEVNLMGQAFCGIHALRPMIARGSGSVVNTFSGAQAGSAFRCAYGSASAGVAGLTYAWAAECAGSSVRVNAIAPIAATREIEETEPVLRRLYEQGRVGADFMKLRAAMAGMTTDMNAPLVIFLLSKASAAVNGQALRLNGNRLHLVTRAAARSPVLASDDWSFERIEEAFATVWKDKLLPLGIAEFDMTYVGKA
jgi:NAD(P)-dependent dehydrogenase (short-subunit alcohol dehydrogenase family)